MGPYKYLKGKKSTNGRLRKRKKKKKKNSLNQMRTVGALPFFIQLIEKEKGKKTSGVIYA